MAGIERKGKNTNWWQEAVASFLKLSGLIATPVIIASFLGLWLQDNYGHSPWIFLACVGISFIFSIWILVVRVIKDFDKMGKEDINIKNDSEYDRRKY